MVHSLCGLSDFLTMGGNAGILCFYVTGKGTGRDFEKDDTGAEAGSGDESLLFSSEKQR